MTLTEGRNAARFLLVPSFDLCLHCTQRVRVSKVLWKLQRIPHFFVMENLIKFCVILKYEWIFNYIVTRKESFIAYRSSRALKFQFIHSIKQLIIKTNKLG